MPAPGKLWACRRGTCFAAKQGTRGQFPKPKRLTSSAYGKSRLFCRSAQWPDVNRSSIFLCAGLARAFWALQANARTATENRQTNIIDNHSPGRGVMSTFQKSCKDQTWFQHIRQSNNSEGNMPYSQMFNQYQDTSPYDNQVRGIFPDSRCQPR
jgi:hypothetical protein